MNIILSHRSAVFIMFFAVNTLALERTESFKEYNMDHFILHVTTTYGSIKNLYLLTDRAANESVSLFSLC